MHPYGVRDVERLLHLSRATLRALIAAGFVSPERGPRNAWRFSFQDLIVLRTAQALADANVPQRRITRAMKELRRQLPASMPLSGLAIGAVADRVVVREAGARWQADSGQYLLEFGGDPDAGSLSVVAPPPSAPDWHARALALEASDPRGALAAYERAVAQDPSNLDARINWGSFLHETGRYAEAERIYRGALEALGSEPVLLYNLGVLLEDMNRRMEAAQAYATAIRANPALADAHYNLGLLYKSLGRPREAIRHMAQYRKLSRA
jgi:tetratricopeptide (TPR) repeat protein